MQKGKKVSVIETIGSVKFYGSRQPDTTPEDMEGTFQTLSEYRDGGIYAGHYAGNSEWERHPKGDEIVMVIDGETTLILLEDNKEKRNLLHKGELIVVPQNTWHRFESPKGVKIMTVTPQPTDHQIEKPSLE